MFKYIVQLYLILLIAGAWHVYCGDAGEGGRSVCEDSKDDARQLRVGEARWSERICIGRQRVRYRLQGLRPNTPYEVRISFPSTNPVRVSLYLDPAVPWPQPEAVGQRGPARRLLDAEKIMFRTDAQGRVGVQGSKDARRSCWLQWAHVDAVFSAQRLALHRDGEAGAPKQLLYDIVLEESYLGVPASSLPLILAAVVLVALALALAPLWSQRGVPAILRWLGGGSGGEQRTAASKRSRR